MAKKRVVKKSQPYEVKNKFTKGNKIYEKGDKIELENENSIQFMKQQQYIY